MPEQWLEKTVTKTLLSALGKPAQTAGIAVGDVLQFREKVPPVPPPPVTPPVDPPVEPHTPPPVEPPPPPADAIDLFVCRMGVRMDPFVSIPGPFAEWGLPPSSPTFQYAAWDQHPKWTVLGYGVDAERTRPLIQNGELLTTIADGGPDAVPGAPEPRRGSNYAALVLLPKAQPEFNGVLHFTFRTERHWGGRRWLEVLAWEAGQPLLRPNTTINPIPEHPTGQGQFLTWIVNGPGGHHLFVDTPRPDGQPGKVSEVVFDPAVEEKRGNPLARRRHWADSLRSAADQDGLPASLGEMTQFDLYLSRTHWEIREAGQRVGRGQFVTPLAWGRVQFGLTHMFYHSDLERRELLAAQEKFLRLGLPQLVEERWLNVTPYHDTRRWDDFVLTREAGLPA